MFNRSRERARMGLGSKFAAASDKDDEESATASFKLSGSDKFISTGEFRMSDILDSYSYM